MDPRETLALRHPDAAVARLLLREAMALRVASWHVERAERRPTQDSALLGVGGAILEARGWTVDDVIACSSAGP